MNGAASLVDVVKKKYHNIWEYVICYFLVRCIKIKTVPLLAVLSILLPLEFPYPCRPKSERHELEHQAPPQRQYPDTSNRLRIQLGRPEAERSAFRQQAKDDIQACRLL
eukprot:m.6380 g.6380  ORF g.6380 m.6380 type:complete len:109 (-) comp3524_c0_seq1:910-1236(-)